MVAERFVNLPLELLPAMHKAILEDIEWSCTVEYCPEEELRCCRWFPLLGGGRVFVSGLGEHKTLRARAACEDYFE